MSLLHQINSFKSLGKIRPRGIRTFEESKQDFEKLAVESGDKITGEYHKTDHIKLKCKRGHDFEITSKAYEDGRRCAKCRKEKPIRELTERVKANNQEQLTPYTGSTNKIDFLCSKGHKFAATPTKHRMKNGDCCYQCQELR